MFHVEHFLVLPGLKSTANHKQPIVIDLIEQPPSLI